MRSRQIKLIGQLFIILVAVLSVISFFPSQTYATDGWTERASAGSRYWTSVSSSSDGTKLAAVVNNGYIYTSADSGATWTERTSAGSRSWKAITSSSDGTKLAAAVNNGYIYTSSDSGVTWTARTSAGSLQWGSIVSSSDGTKLAAADGNNGSGGYIYLSIDSGITWTAQTNLGIHSWLFQNSIKISSDGTKLVAGVYNGYIYTSTDSGATWTAQTSSGQRFWYGVTSSSDGTKLAAYEGGGYIYTSADSGVTWTEQTSAGYRYWSSITSSPDGTKLAATAARYDHYDYIYTSTDSGVTWTAQTFAGSRYWTFISSSSDGTKLAAVVNIGYIYTFGIITALNPILKSPKISNPTTIILNGYSDTENTTRGFEYGLDTSYGQTIVETGSFIPGSFSATISSINPGVVYHYRVYITKGDITGYSADSTFILDYKVLTQTSSDSHYWRFITSSADGTKLAAIDNDNSRGGYIYF